MFPLQLLQDSWRINTSEINDHRTFIPLHLHTLSESTERPAYLSYARARLTTRTAAYLSRLRRDHQLREACRQLGGTFADEWPAN